MLRHDTLEGAPHSQGRAICSVFDCANPCGKIGQSGSLGGTSHIRHDGGRYSVQFPGISKTFNMRQQATVKEGAEAYMLSGVWV